MIDDKLRSLLEAIRDGEITSACEVRPVIVEAQRIINEAVDKLYVDRCLIDAAKENFALGWEEDLIEHGGAAE